MKASIRTKFSLGIIFLFVIIALLSFFSAYFVNRLSNKTSAILKENHLSVIFARDMSENLMKINLEISNCLLSNKEPDKLFIKKEFSFFEKSLALEKNNITEPGEDKLVADIEVNYKEYRDSVLKFADNSQPFSPEQNLQMKFSNLYQQLILLSQINGKAIETKTEDAKVSAKNALKQMTILASLCFIIALSFSYSFASYFNERFNQLFKGIKELASTNYGQRLHFDGTDEFHEISLVFNKMAENLSKISKKTEAPEPYLEKIEYFSDDIQELKEILSRLKNFEAQASKLLSKLENKNVK
jgi:two-component system, NtrC family, sensor histidine kinase KinB